MLPTATTSSDDRPKRLSHDEPGQLVRVAEFDRRVLPFMLDGRAVTALAGDTVLTAILVQQRRLGVAEFGGAPRAGFCLMGACQDCWVRTEDGSRLRSCTTLLREGMRILTQESSPPCRSSIAP